MNLGRMQYFLRLKVLSDSDGYYSSQEKYDHYLLYCVRITYNKIACTHLEPNSRIHLYDGTQLKDVILCQ